MSNSIKNPNKTFSYDVESVALTFAKIAHEIKNPLTIISSTLQIIELQYPIVKNSVHWNSIYNELDFIIDILNDFNVLCNSSKYTFKKVNFSNLLFDVCHKYKPITITNEISLITNDIAKDLYVYGDSMRLIEAFSNLIKNAIEAVEPKQGVVNITAKEHLQYLEVVIQDNGIGISDSYLKEIFKPFVTFKPNGTGLGLPITKSIIEAHNGTININSELNVGTKITATLPLYC